MIEEKFDFDLLSLNAYDVRIENQSSAYKWSKY